MSQLVNVQGERDLRTRRPIYSKEVAEAIAKPTSATPLVEGGEVLGQPVESDLPFNTTAQITPRRKNADQFFASRLDAPATGNPDANDDRTGALDLEAMQAVAVEDEGADAAAGDPRSDPAARSEASQAASQGTATAPAAPAKGDTKKAAAAKGEGKG